ncbi:homocysteine S-methyltransferase family protein [Candidatus Sumerlaeota bacterium]|nr:homocysteine S-methyltransferase family protein [Candidatus Sumerlaeota bacterium]
MSSLLYALKRRPLLSDGALGTQLLLAGLKKDECGESWNLERRESVLNVQRQYVQAGADCLTTNTFGGCRLALARHGLEDKTMELNQAAVQIAREAFESEKKEGFVLGSIGPLPEGIEPRGSAKKADAASALREQAEILTASSVDAIILETQVTLDELEIGVEAARQAGAPCIIGSIAFEFTDGAVRTADGATPDDAAQFMVERKVDIIGMNCGRNIDIEQAQAIIEQFAASCKKPLMARPNAGQPKVGRGGKLNYPLSPRDMADGISFLIHMGARIVGGCCGTTPEYIHAFRKAVDRWQAEQTI